ncbi:hypothetical protein PsYK624_001170 [Phanerochaete sordida]|uniref:BTB domain-containing protein n=1 Tax=Phanerochaete sordida TaxID=48140 RepID=A0A9P3L7V7_9APHY|nr:hypothetical protein PsYK624_001170 [Phanerochaete sordida]
MHFRYLSMTSGTPSEIPEYISSNESFVNIQEMSQSSPTSGSISPSSSPAADTGQPGPSAHDDTLEKKHPEYYFDDGSVEFVVEGLRYRVHQYLFSRDSPYWANIFTRPLPLEPLDLPSGKDVLDFDAFLAVLYATCYRPPGISTTREWSAVLCLATEWSFDGIRRLAIEHLEATASPIEKIVLSHSHAIPEWLPVAYVSLCQRDSPLSAAEIRAVRAEDVELIMSVREALLRERVPLDTSDVSAHVARAMELSRTAEASTSSESASEPIIPEELASTGSAAETTQAAEQRVPESPEESDFTSPPPISPLDGDLPLDDVADSIPSTSRHIATQDACAEVAAHLALLTPTNSTEVGERIVETINSSVDGHAMILQAIKDIFDKAGTGQALADVYALVCTELAWNADLNEISASLDDANPKPISGSALFPWAERLGLLEY